MSNSPVGRQTRMSTALLARTTITVLLVIGAIICLYPLFYTFVTALKSEKEFAINPFSLPLSPTLGNFAVEFVRFNILRLALNSVMATAGGVVLCTIVSFMVAYAVTKIRFRGGNLVFAFLVGTLVIPFPTVMVPAYLTLLDLHLVGKYYGLILLWTAYGLPLGVYLLSAYLRGIPDEIGDATKIDGANHWRTMWEVMAPIARPGVAALAIINAVWMWNDLLSPLLVMPDVLHTTLMVAVASQRNNIEVNIPIISAGLSLATIPVLLVYLVFQRFLIKGMTEGAVK